MSDYFGDLVAHEGFTTWLYCDSRGFVTTGIGNLIASPAACSELLWYHPESPDELILPVEAEDSYKRVLGAFDATKSAAYYKQFSDIRLSEYFVQKLVEKRLDDEFIPGIIRLCHDFDTWPLPARRAIVDMAYNLGIGGLAKFNSLLDACQTGKWRMAAGECHRSTCRESRNLWTAQMFIEAAATV